MKKMRKETNGMFVQNALLATTGMIMKEFVRLVVLITVTFAPQSLNAENALKDTSFNTTGRHVKRSMNIVQSLLKSTTSLQMISHLISIVTNVQKTLTLTMKQRAVNHVPSFPTVLNVQMQLIVQSADRIGNLVQVTFVHLHILTTVK